MTTPMSYGVQDVGLEVQVFPQYDGKQVRFVTAQPGEKGASGLKLQLGSITARGIKETSSEPVTNDEVDIDQLEEIDEDAKQTLRRLGVRSSRDLERLEERNVDLETVTDRKLDYGSLAGVINKARRRQVAPSVAKALVRDGADGLVLALHGSNLDIAPSLPAFPLARINGEPADVVASSPELVEVRIDPHRLAGRRSRLDIALDPFAVVSMEVDAS